ncbi:MAG: hypothetical protein QGF79_04000 [Arenicellales bacterium]|nr:hypothetical protein [Arenicellales bacterium]MDP6550569.1 hypothetical protein [Arenicellales bacterium]MDP6917644.1 hypothetical protein [Arenicellales bacterium]
MLVLVMAIGKAEAHSPWSQYQVYRQEHLMIMSTRVDQPTYEYSLLLIDAINEILPEASARPARAKDWVRVHSLFKTKQIPLVLLSSDNANGLISGSGPFSGEPAVNAVVLYRFGDLILLAHPDFPEGHAWLVTNAIMEQRAILPGAADPSAVQELTNLHNGARSALAGKPLSP